jgi:hypothetical protein
MLKKIGLVLLLAVVGFVGFAATRPDTYRVERSLTMAAPADVAFAYVNDFHKWEGWSPWEALDRNAKKTYEGPATGTGASYGWNGNNEVGEGRMTITNSRPNERVEIKLEFIKPMAAVNKTDFSFKPAGEGVNVTWTIDGNHNFMSKAMCVFVDMDSMIGKSFEQGLASLKGLVEEEAKKVAEAKKAAEAAAAAAAAPPADAAPTAVAAPAKP